MSSSKITETTALLPQIGDPVDYEESNGTWTAGFKLLSFEQEFGTGLNWATIKWIEGDGVELRVPLARIRKPQPILSHERKIRAACNEAWQARCKQLKLKGVTRERQLEAFLQCYVAMGIATGLMKQGDHIQFLVAVGRGEEFLSGQL